MCLQRAHDWLAPSKIVMMLRSFASTYAHHEA
jgi:hypothetical protein